MRSLLSLPVLVAFGLFSSPARALPAASMQLFRVDGNGVKPLPAVSAILDSAQAGSATRPSAQTSLAAAVSAVAAPTAQPGSVSPESIDTATPASFITAAQPRELPASPVTGVNGQLLAQENSTSAAPPVLSQQFAGPLPRNLSGNIRLVNVAEDGTLGSIVEEIPFSSSNVSFSPDRTQLFVRPSTPIAPGQSVMMQLPSRSLEGISFVYPNHLVSTPCIFKASAVSALPAAGAAPAAAAPAAAAGAAATAPVAAAAAFPIWAVVAGVIVVGVGVAAASGAFSSGGGGGGTNPSSQ
jgi:hypothetical protein